jgi:hypothetical protein
VGCRPFSILLLAVAFIYIVMNERRTTGKNPAAIILKDLKYLAIPAAIGFGYLYFNYIRFGNWFDFGRAYMPEFAEVGGVEFSLGYIPSNLRILFVEPVRMLADGSLSFPAFNGFLFFVANPVFNMVHKT